jgi:signal transduction histidine kinase
MEQLYNFFVFFGSTVFNVLVSLTLFKRRKSLAFTLVVYAIWEAVVTVAGFIPEAKYFPFLIFLFFLAFVLTLVCYEGGAWQKLFVSICIINNSTLIGYLVSPVAEAISPFGSDLFFLWQTILMLIVFIVELILLIRHMRGFVPKLFELKGNIWILFSAGAWVARMMLQLCGPQSEYIGLSSLASVNRGGVFEYYLVILASIWCSASVIFAIDFTRRRVSDGIELRNSKTALEAAKVHYSELTHSLEEAAALRHDIKHHLNAISELTAKKDRSGVEKLVSETQSSIKAPVRYCGHGVADALLGWYAKRIGEDGIAFETDVAITNDIPVESTDLCVLLGNLLDNAHRAARSAGEEPYIHIRAKTKPNMLVIETENNFGGKLTQKDGKYISAKENGGQGLKSVSLICEKYNGTFIPNVENQKFTTLSMLNW